MSGRCAYCNIILTTGEIEICSSCREERNKASYKTYENGYTDGFKAGQQSVQSMFDEAVRMLQNNTPRYLVVTQEKYDEILKGKNEVE